MSDFARQWVVAFALTQLVEIPVYLAFARRLPLGRRWLYAASTSTVTHPLLWFALPWHAATTEGAHASLLVAGELGVVAVEAAIGLLFRAPRPLLAAIVANGTSVLVGFLVQ